jgi:glucuronate isomerase
MTYIHDDFLLQTEWARQLYHEHAKDLPIIDYHCHLPPQEIANDQTWDNLSQVWLGGDHYKWRAMRTNGISEKYCSGTASDREKFDVFCSIMPKLLKNPIYHWSHLELAKYFNFNQKLISDATSQEIWDSTLGLFENGLSAKDLITQSKVEVICTTDDPTDSLEHHAKVATDTDFKAGVFPTWRPDKSLAIQNGTIYLDYIKSLSSASGIEINSFETLIKALENRHDFFHENGCRLSDHGLETVIAEFTTQQECNEIFQRALKGKALSDLEVSQFQTHVLFELMKLNAQKGWVQQMHIGAIRNNNSKMFDMIGPDTGFDSMGDSNYAKPLSALLDKLNQENLLCKTILYNLNPKDNAMMATMIGNFQDGETAGKIQWGSGWWFMDQKDGMEQQIETLSLMGTLSQFVGMLTDSRSFLSYTRHEYFRRILCNMLGNDVHSGVLPQDTKLIGKMVEDICYYNAKNYFGLKPKT